VEKLKYIIKEQEKYLQIWNLIYKNSKYKIKLALYLFYYIPNIFMCCYISNIK